ncbi:hypothetical protein KKP04_12165 [Rhodomicrobium sp. Az07]|uniref:hypothetical protein n=1 Tax=Rhodomicrobium sp. Az07 TaxID=2839034 RepID=UPI001BEC8D57|nr:hypothetical protein [Rhodomicrobium sp. Az07]MBT3071620.1 hypothetical protein [Rhodomicrobium sp. Az07]
MKTLALAVAAVFLLATAASFNAEAASRNQGQLSQSDKRDMQSGKSYAGKEKNKTGQYGKSGDRRAKARTSEQRSGQYGGR